MSSEVYIFSEIPERVNKIIFWKYPRKQKLVQSHDKKHNKAASVNAIEYLYN